MTSDTNMIAPSDQKHAFIREGALILYFDKAETPFVARFDLESLAQASFEVTDKKDGFYHLVLNNYTVGSQTVGQFGSKNDAHQALYEILQALLSYNGNENMVCARKPKGCNSFFWRLLKWILLSIVTLLVIYALLILIPVPKSLSSRVEAPATQKAGSNALSALPEGEAVDADSVLPPTFSNLPAAAE